MKATPDSATGNDQAQSPRVETAGAATTHPKRNPNKGCKDLFKRPESVGGKGRLDNESISAKTVLVKLPVMTAVETARGIAKRSNAYWQAIVETAIITAIPAINPSGAADGLATTQKTRTVASSTN
jgi:hypothetical protein